MIQAPQLSAGASRWLLLALWLAVSAALLAINAHFIGPMNFRDPDDALRLVEVRDLLAGQGWFDPVQHRIHAPWGVEMHWSRLVDVPIALILALLKPILGVPVAERATLIIVPLAELLALIIVVYAIARKLRLGRATAVLAAALLVTSVSILIQFAPLRIDHHGTQILFGGLAVLAMVGTERRDGRKGLLAGLAMAVWMAVSIEGLPCAIALGAVFALRHVLFKDRWQDLRFYLLALTGGSAFFLFGTHLPVDAMRPWCDAMSPNFLAPLGAATAIALLAKPLMPADNLVQRAAPLALAGAAGAIVFLSIAPQCLAGPFKTLNPTVYRFWYEAVKEGLPITEQKPDLQAMIVLPVILGLAGSALAWWRAGTVDQRMAWASLIVMELAAFGVSLGLMRAMSFAHLIALPGNAVLLASLMTAAQRLRVMPLRIAFTAGTVVLSPFGAAAAMAAALDPPANTHGKPVPEPVVDRFRCTTYETLRGLDALPPALLFTPLDIGAHLLVYTHHSVVGTGHHRNVEGMKAVLDGLLSPPAQAQKIIAATGAKYFAYCRGENEVVRYAARRPNSLIAALLKGDRPDWLVPVPLPAGESIRLYRIVPPAPHEQLHPVEVMLKRFGGSRLPLTSGATWYPLDGAGQKTS